MAGHPTDATRRYKEFNDERGKTFSKGQVSMSCPVVSPLVRTEILKPREDAASLIKVARVAL